MPFLKHCCLKKKKLVTAIILSIGKNVSLLFCFSQKFINVDNGEFLLLRRKPNVNTFSEGLKPFRAHIEDFLYRDG